MQWDSVAKSAIQEKKIRVTWLAPSQEGPSAATPVRQMGTNGVRLPLSLIYQIYTATNSS
jgi:hypothetical protein